MIHFLRLHAPNTYICLHNKNWLGATTTHKLSKGKSPK